MNNDHPARSALLRLAIALLPLALVSCTHHADATGPHGQIRAVVQNEFRQPVAGKLIEVRELDLRKYTGTNGLATFTVPPGDYVVRAYAIGVPGPGSAYVDEDVSVAAGETSIARFLDCQTCVAPASRSHSPGDATRPR